MKSKNPLILFFTLLLMVLTFSAARAQEQAPDDNPRPVARPFKIMQELGLTREQIQQIRRIQQARRPIMQDAQLRWQAARRDLDAAMYADDTSEEQMKELTRTAMAAQSEFLKERTLTEYLIRKVLTPEQLIKFRELREGLMRRVKEQRNAPADDAPETEPQRPLNRFQQRRLRRGQ